MVKCLKTIGEEDAECNNDGKVRGTIRSLNLSYNPFLRGDEHLRRKLDSNFGDTFDSNAKTSFDASASNVGSPESPDSESD